MVNPKNSVVLTGSLAYDHIMTFPDYFKNHIAPEKIPVLSVSFQVDTLHTHFGGTAGNIAYNMHLFGMHPTLLATGGKDFASYNTWLKDNSISTDHIKTFEDIATGQAFIITDRDNSQIAAFHPGSMNRAQDCSLDDLEKKPELVVISANGIDGMKKFVHECRERKIPYIYDPGQAIPGLEPFDLKEGIIHAKLLTLNEYELHMIMKATDLSLDGIREYVETVIVTYGAKGSVVYTDSKEIHIPIAYATQLIDPTGCGDAHRAGILFGIGHKLPWEVTGRIGALAATYAIEKLGTQNHYFTFEEFGKRYAEAFGEPLHLSS